MKVSVIKKVFTILMIVATLSLSSSMLLSGTAYATGSTGTGTTATGALEIPAVNAGTTPGALQATTKNVLTIVAYLCYTAAVILLIMLGIKYMTQAPDGKAEIKKMAITYVIGAILVFAAGLVLQVLSSVFNDAIKVQ